MHYGKNSFAKDKKKPTIIQKMTTANADMGQRKSDKNILNIYRVKK